MPIPNRIPRRSRSMLFVPATRWNMIEKAASSATDAICLDLEDSVAPAEKPAARANVARALRELDFGQRTRILRINALDTPYAYRDLIEVAETAGATLDLIMLPKVESPAHVQFIDTLLTQIELAHGFEPGRIGIEAQIETASGCLHVAAIAAASPRLEALIYGPGDFAASMRMPLANIGEADQHDALYPGHRWHYVMQSIVVAARAHDLRCMDGPYAAFRDTEGLEQACQIARALGFDGKQCIHPAQLEIVNRLFAPSAAEIAWAEQVVAAYQEALLRGDGAIRIGDRMIDMASIRMAQTIIDSR
ncbi:MAG: CoA ester lyase [Roseiflexaceae bacterium]|nr:CoA ester lyase [Roseiflexaceae bacterium]